MKLYTAEINSHRTVLVSPKGSDKLFNMAETSFGIEDMNELIKTHSFEEIIAVEKECASLSPVDFNKVTILSPIVEPRQDVLCLGINYWAHAAEASKFSDKDFGGKREKTIYFAKRASEISGPCAGIPSYPGLVESLDYEVELGVVLSKDARNVKAEDVDDYILGYTVFNDVSARNLQTGHKQWYFGKSLDGHTVMGPYILTRDEIGDVYNLYIRCYINGELRQDGNTGLMIQKIGETVAELSQGITLKAGTIIATGTPAGVGMGFNPPKFLKKGDVVRCEIEKLGVLENTVI
jgi:2-keto-4-pentenoate hydratase/2-oxohepta-3-ene-1,7-dioic acid hydratase (catechol pathway)